MMPLPTQPCLLACRLLLGCLLFAPCLCPGQANGDWITIYGYVTERNSNEAVIGANVTAVDSVGRPLGPYGSSTNTYGFYSFRTRMLVPLRVRVSAIGYSTITERIDLLGKSSNFQLEQATFALEPVTVHTPGAPGKPDILIEPQKIKELPAFLAESDPMKYIQTFPGIKQGREGASGLYVRGGTPDQNLILLDGIPIYNSNHLFGYLSVFNTDAIRNIHVYTQGIPARYEGRLSSVIDIALKEGNLKSKQGSFTVSPIAGTWVVEWPLRKDKSSYMLAMRRTWLDALYAVTSLASGEKRGLNFFDVSAKVQHKFNEKHSVQASLYTNRDRFFDRVVSDGGQKSAFGFDWGNLTALVRFSSAVSSRAFLNMSAHFSRYGFNQKDKYTTASGTSFRKSNSKIREFGLQSVLDWYRSGWRTTKAGVQLSHRLFEPEVIQLVGGSRTVLRSDELNKTATNVSLFAEEALTFSPRASLTLNLRATFYGQASHARLFWQPRATLHYKLPHDVAADFSYDRIAQTVHLLTNSTLGQPTDLWLPATEKAPAGQSNQYALRLAKALGQYVLTVNAYYKQMENLLEYKEGASITYGIDQGWEEKVSSGTGRTKGIEVLVAKRAGRLSGHIGYTLSRTTRRFQDINNGKVFPFRYDRTHDGTLVVSYRLTERSRLGGFFTYNTGNAITLPVAKSRAEPPPLWNLLQDEAIEKELANRELLTERNNARMPAYHRLDLSYSNTKTTRRNRQRTWTASVYNAYNRLNPYFLFLEGGSIRQYALFPVIPSVAYGLAF